MANKLKNKLKPTCASSHHSLISMSESVAKTNLVLSVYMPGVILLNFPAWHSSHINSSVVADHLWYWYDPFLMRHPLLWYKNSDSGITLVCLSPAPRLLFSVTLLTEELSRVWRHEANEWVLTGDGRWVRWGLICVRIVGGVPMLRLRPCDQQFWQIWESQYSQFSYLNIE